MRSQAQHELDRLISARRTRLEDEIEALKEALAQADAEAADESEFNPSPDARETSGLLK